MRNKPTIILSSVLAILTLLTFISCSKDKPSTPPAQVPTLTTAAVSDITPTTARCGGIISSDGGAIVIHRGVCWNTNPMPVYFHDQTYDSTGTGTFTSIITGLNAATHYYVRAYAMNDAGIGYGDTLSFTTANPDSSGTIIDINNNIYRTIKIGTQWWMAENLKVTNYRNGDSIPNVTSDSTWKLTSLGGYCNYNDDIGNVAVYGRLYNWFAVNDSRNIAPVGWHVASDSDWQVIIEYLGGYQIAGGKLKESGTSHWDIPNLGATNESGFSGLPGGVRSSDNGAYAAMGNYANFWTSTEYFGIYSWNIYLYSNSGGIYRQFLTKRQGFSVRCVKD